MSALRLLTGQGIAGIGVSLALLGLLLVEKGETRHWKKQSARLEQLYRAEHSAFAATVADYRAAAEAARAADRANAERVAAEQRAISERTIDDYQTRIASAHASAERLRDGLAAAAANSGGGGAAPVPGLPAAPGGAAQSAGPDRLSLAERLTATEQAIQLDELIRWIEAQAAVDPNSEAK